MSTPDLLPILYDAARQFITLIIVKTETTSPIKQGTEFRRNAKLSMVLSRSPKCIKDPSYGSHYKSRDDSLTLLLQDDTLMQSW